MNFWKIESKKRFWFLYTLLFILICIIIFMPFLIKGNSFIRDGDGFNQTYPVLIYIGRYLREWVQNGLKFKSFDFTLGLGEDVITSLTWLGFGDVFTVISAFFPADKTAYLFSFIVILKLYCSGAAFAAYGFHRGFHNNAILLGSLLYAFNRFSLTMGLEFYQTLNPVVWLPLLALGIDKLLYTNQKIKFSPIFVIAVFVQSINGFYFLYMNTIFCAVYFCVAYLTMQQEKRSFLDFCKKSLRIILNYILGVMLGAFIFIPALVGYFESSRTGRSFQSIKALLLFPNSVYLGYLKCLLIPKAWQQSLTLPVVCVVSLIVMLDKTYKNRFLKIMCGLFLLLFLFPFTGSIMNGFSYSIDRWSFMIYFLCGILVTDILSKDVKIKIKQIVLLGIVAVISLGLHLLSGEGKLGLTVKMTVYLILILISIVFLVNRLRRGKNISICTDKELIGISLWVVANIVINGLFINGPVVLGGDGYSAGFRAYEGIYKQIEDSVANGLQNDDDFYRVDAYDSSLGSSLVLDYKGATQYFSILNDNIFEFFKQMSISPGIRSVSHIIKGVDSRIVIESLLSVKYFQDFKENSFGEYEPYIIENPYSLPLGFTYESYILKEEFDSLTDLQKMQVLMEAVVVEEPLEGLEKKVMVDATYRELKKRVSLENIRVDGNRMFVDQNSCINVDIEEIPYDESGELYVRLNGLKLYTGMSSDIQVENKSIQIRNSQDFYYIGVDDFLVKISAPEDGRVEIRFEKEAEISLDSVQVFWYDLQDFAKQATALGENHLEDLCIQNGNIFGNISLTNNKCLFLSIPYSPGWKAQIDGESVKIYRSNIGFMAIPLEAGEHSVELKYMTPGMKQGIIFAVAGFIIFITLLSLGKRAGEE